MALLRVATESPPKAVAGAIAGLLRQEGVVEIQVIGAGALNQAVKAIAVAGGFMREEGLGLICVPSFAIVMVQGQERTAIRLRVESVRLGGASAPNEMTPHVTSR